MCLFDALLTDAKILFPIAAASNQKFLIDEN